MVSTSHLATKRRGMASISDHLLLLKIGQLVAINQTYETLRGLRIGTVPTEMVVVLRRVLMLITMLRRRTAMIASMILAVSLWRITMLWEVV